MTYDALLSLRGWTTEMFRAARPDFLAAARFALYVERLMPLFDDMKRVQATPLPKGPGYGEAAMGKIAAGKAIELMRPVLFPEDDDGIA